MQISNATADPFDMKASTLHLKSALVVSKGENFDDINITKLQSFGKCVWGGVGGKARLETIKEDKVRQHTKITQAKKHKR
jgi:hypothetical protein